MIEKEGCSHVTTGSKIASVVGWEIRRLCIPIWTVNSKRKVDGRTWWNGDRRVARGRIGDGHEANRRMRTGGLGSVTMRQSRE
ncbi:hypothetical protein TSUD_274420 [Trifolium subterraneum]|uniref:Uncharacterized protein n=1 Tax=Trifolium subterraneum TaxID=3900 RepID=A0A2Z6NN88_TRISU|nr:hypothetical protein TSUD_274420 [Trifolium subterraneum]